MQNKLSKEILVKILLIILLIPLFAILYKIYIPRVSAFGCFDDCFYIVAGFFIKNGKHIYSDFFFNHQPIAAFISYIIQLFTEPKNIFELILRHRQFIIAFGFFFNVLLVLRFGLIAFVFAILYEFSKFYLFGDRFLAETFIVYPVVYLFGISLLTISQNKIYFVDYILSAILSWFIVFSREPYAPLALFLFFIVQLKSTRNKKLISFGIFILLTLITFMSLDLKDYFFNVVNINFNIVLPAELGQQIYGGFLQMFFYPVFILIDGPWNVFKMLLVGLDVLFLLLCLKLLKNKKLLLLAFILFSIFLANLKPNLPGKLFYESFHMIIWYATFLFTILFLIFREKKILFLIPLSYATLIFVLFVLSPANFIYEKINPHEELITNYGSILQEGEVVKALSSPNSTLFLDGSDDLVYWQSGLTPSYKYTWYTSVMPHIPLYTKARVEMFKASPPSFYRSVGLCIENNNLKNLSLPTNVYNDYIRLLVDSRPSCLWIRKDIIKDIKSNQWDKAREFNYYLPKSEEI